MNCFSYVFIKIFVILFSYFCLQIQILGYLSTWQESRRNFHNLMEVITADTLFTLR
jgi:hypothetical protein